MPATPTITCLLLLALTSCGLPKTPAPAPPARAAAATEPTPVVTARLPATLPDTDDPFYILWQTYAPYTAASDPLGFPMKVRNLSTSAYRFWRGSKELFYVWCKAHAADWLADRPAYLRIHGDLHLGNMGVYPAAGGPLGQSLAFGAVDFDESARLPFQLELLQGVVTFQLLAHDRQVRLDADKLDQLIAAMLDAYRAALRSDRSPTQLLDADPWVAHLLKDARKHDYASEIDKCVRDDHLVAHEKFGARPRDRVQGVTDRAGLAEAISQAFTHTPDARPLFSVEALPAAAIRDVARRTKLESAGSEGLNKFLVLVDAPAAQTFTSGRAILYLKQQIPSAAERVGLIPLDPRPPGQRCADDAQNLQSPAPCFNAWCDWRDASYRVTLREPWSQTFDAAMVDKFDDLLHTAKIWGTLAGCLHRQGSVELILGRLTPDFVRQLKERGAAYTAKVLEDHHRFDRDPRTKALIKQAETALKTME